MGFKPEPGGSVDEGFDDLLIFFRYFKDLGSFLSVPAEFHVVFSRFQVDFKIVIRIVGIIPAFSAANETIFP